MSYQLVCPSWMRTKERNGGHASVLVSYGSPYLLRQVPSVSAYVCAYGGAESSHN